MFRSICRAYRFSYEELESFTNGFSEENLIGKFQFGVVYRGIWKDYSEEYLGEVEDLELVVKMYEDPLVYKVCPGDTLERIDQELTLSRYYTRNCDPYLQPNLPHANLPHLFGVWSEGERGACVYRLKPLDSLNNLISKDSFNWLQRIKVALGFASVLEFLHSHDPPHLPCLIRNIDAAHIMVDKDHRPILFDFSMISGGVLIDRKDIRSQYVHGCYGYIDPNLSQGGWSEKCDVFAYGVVLLGLIMKKVYTDEDRENHAPFIYELANSEYNSANKSVLVHQSLGEGPFFFPSDGIKITELAMRCVDFDPQKRPTMKQILRCFQELCISSLQADTLGIGHTLVACDSETQGGQLSEFFPNSNHDEPILSEGRRISNTSTQTGKECDVLRIFSSENLSFYTNKFSEENLIGEIVVDQVYLGEMEGKNVTVKIFQRDYERLDECSVSRLKLRKELVLLKHPKLIAHPNLAKLIGYCEEEDCLGIVYDLNPVNNLNDLLPKDTFTWSQRIRVAFEIAHLLKYLYTSDPPYQRHLVCNIKTTNIMLDQEYKPKLIDIGESVGGIIPLYDEETWHPYKHRFRCRTGNTSDTETCDVHSFGMILLCLIVKKAPECELYAQDYPWGAWIDLTFLESKRQQWSIIFDSLEEMPLFWWMENEPLERCERMLSEEFDGDGCKLSSLVNKSLEQDPGFCSSDGLMVTKLALQCIMKHDFDRPDMADVLKALSKLRVVKSFL